jgi:DNA polymerase I
VSPLKGLDGRDLHIRSEHSALNTLLQSAGAIVCKQWIVEFDRLLREAGLRHLVRIVAWVHDELQMEVDLSLITDGVNAKGEPCKLSIVGDMCIQAIVEAGHKLGITVPLTGEYKIGNNWKETH